ncbi:hypothetical protein K488DRAFT_83107 [Vararia minispora EC-137]|uniref:Uncharacterized protein n=1 Tax=Vararia minispora EC-137 TaxID=1314806 RepID=A0ACB8QV29_9AGAM|nr:hypothetical protein K488DRAFT_83107 [Vararia minispora EC-137]
MAALAISRTPSLSFSERTDDSASFPVTPVSSQMLEHPRSFRDKGKAPAHRPPPSAYPPSRSSRFRPVSVFLPAQSRLSLPSILQTPGVLRRILPFLHWSEFHSISLSSKECLNLVKDPELKDVILSRFVPGYRYCLAQSDTASYREVPLRFKDLDLFMRSQRLPLHKYPMYSLSILSALLPNDHQNAKLQSCAALCLAHSRAVLLLQSLVHSSQLPVNEDADDLRFRLRSTAAAWASNSRAVRELVFPAPLSYFGQSAASTETESSAAEPGAASMPPKKSKKKLFPIRRASHSRAPSASPSTSSLSGRRRPSTAPNSPPPARPTSFFLSLNNRSSSRLPVPPPPPEEDTMGLQMYAGSWRRARRQSMWQSGSMSDSEDFLFRRPQRHFATTTPTTRSSRSSIDWSPSPASRENPPAAAPTITGPHDIRLATSRLRAPVLRVFHPCIELDDAAIEACEDQLDDAGLWTHLSTGDIVCNLGYIPPEDAANGSTSSSDVSSADNHALWLVFDGSRLVSFDLAAPLPLADPLALPSPLYYLHVTPTNVNPRMRLVLPLQEDPHLTLMSLPTTVRSPHSPRGLARTRRYMWVAQVHAQRREDLGAGWQGEWTLEGEGTKEGRQGLLDALSGGVECEYEMVVEKTTGTQLWLRCVSA